MCRRANRRISHDAVTGLPTSELGRPSSSRMVESTLGIGTLPPQAGVYVPRRLSQVYGSVTSRGKASAMSSFPLFTWLVSCHLGALFDHGFALAYGGRLGPRFVPPAASPGVVALDRDGGLGLWPGGFAAADRRAPSGGDVGGGLRPASPSYARQWRDRSPYR